MTTILKCEYQAYTEPIDFLNDLLTPKGFNLNNRGCNPRYRQENPLTTLKGLNRSNIQPLQGCDIQIRDDRGFTPTVIQIVPLRGTINLN